MSYLSCDSSDGPDFYSAKEVTARKSHKCCECGGTIPAGEKYLRCVGKWESGIETLPQHLLCAEACEYVRDTVGDGDYCLAFGTLLMWFDSEMDISDSQKAEVLKDKVKRIRERLASQK